MAEVGVGKAIMVAAPVIAFVITVLFVASFLISALLGLPFSLSACRSPSGP